MCYFCHKFVSGRFQGLSPRKRFVSAERPETVEGAQYHIACKRGEVGRYVLLPGDPERVPKIAKLWDEAREVAYHREYRTWTGRVGGMEISACSTGIGCPSAVIALEELARIGADTFIRVGSTGAIQPDIKCGDLIISTGAVRLEGTSREYVRVEYPAVANYEVVLALIEAAEKLGYRYHMGITATTDSFYVGQGRPGFRGFKQSWVEALVPDLRKANVLNFEMEAAALLTIASLYRLRMGVICAVFAEREVNKLEAAGEDECCETAVEAVRILSKWDKAKAKAKKKFWHPSLSLR